MRILGVFGGRGISALQDVLLESYRIPKMSPLKRTYHYCSVRVHVILPLNKVLNPLDVFFFSKFCFIY